MSWDTIFRDKIFSCWSLSRNNFQRLLFYCAFGERSAMAVQAAQDASLIAACHIEGGLDAWKKAGGPLAR
jgi:sulfur dioxygenase